MESNRTGKTQEAEIPSVHVDDVHLESQNTAVSENNIWYFHRSNNYSDPSYLDRENTNFLIEILHFQHILNC